jgi:hypothetical protein
MLYPIWTPLPRPPCFPESPELNRLLDRYDPEVGYFKLSLRRREARDLRKGLFGPKGLRVVPRGYGVRQFRLPRGWILRLTYHPACWEGQVTAELIPPTMREWPPLPPQWPENVAA